MPRRVQHVFFDATGTLLRVRGSVGAAYAGVAARHGHGVDAAAVDRAFRGAFATAPPLAFPGVPATELERHERDWWRDVVHRTFEPFGPFPDFEHFFDAVYAYFQTGEPWEVLPGVRSTLETLRAQGRRLGVISDMDSRLLEILIALRLRLFFDVIVLSSNAGFVKPDPRLFETAMAQAGAVPERSVHVGDSLRRDVEGARAAGMLAILHRGAAAPTLIPDVPSISTLDELPSLLDRLELAP